MVKETDQVALRNLLLELAVRRSSHLGNVVEFGFARTMVKIKKVMIVFGDFHLAIHTLADLQFGVNRSVSSLEDILLVPARTAVAGLLGGIELGGVSLAAPAAVSHRLI